MLWMNAAELHWPAAAFPQLCNAYLTAALTFRYAVHFMRAGT
jgi:hypothetical protein